MVRLFVWLLLIGALVVKLRWDHRQRRRLQRLQRRLAAEAALRQRQKGERFQLTTDFLNGRYDEAEYRRRCADLESQHRAQWDALGRDF